MRINGGVNFFGNQLFPSYSESVEVVAGHLIASFTSGASMSATVDNSPVIQASVQSQAAIFAGVETNEQP